MENLGDPETILVKYPQFLKILAKVQACFDSFSHAADPRCIPIVGESGAGKTRLITHFVSLYPCQDHKSGAEIPVLVAKVPPKPTVKSLAETLLVSLGDPLYDRGNTVNKSIRIREIMKRCGTRLLALDDFQHFVDSRRVDVANEVADWLKEQVEVARMPIVVLGLSRGLEVLRQNEQLRRRFGATVRIGEFDWSAEEDRTTYRAFLQAVQTEMSGYQMPPLAEVHMAFRVYYASFGLVGYTMKIIRAAAKLAEHSPKREITMEIFSEAYKNEVWREHLDKSNPFQSDFDPATAPPLVLPSSTLPTRHKRDYRKPKPLELHA